MTKLNVENQESTLYDVIIIGGGQSALACGFYLRRTNLNYIILDEQAESGGAWNHGWDSLSLFSPAEFSSLPGFMFPKSENYYPSRNEVISYLDAYQKKYELPVKHSVQVTQVSKENNVFTLKTSTGDVKSKAVISATGTWANPFVPAYKGQDIFKGIQLHSANYKNAKDFVGQKVLVVGGGNSGAQLVADISLVTETVWSTLKPPTFLPDDIDGRVLFDVATEMYKAKKEGKTLDISSFDLANIVMVPSVVNARERGVLHSKGSINELTENGVIWKTGEVENFDIIVWCTGFEYATNHLENLGIRDEFGRIETAETKATATEGLWLVGYGNWTGFASATLIGVGRSARSTVQQVKDFLSV